MILVDANLLIYAHVASFSEHDGAHDWLDEQINGSAQVGMPWPSLLAFVRIVSNPRIFERPEHTVHAWNQVLAWLRCDTVWIPQPTERHASILGHLIAIDGVVDANMIPDAHLAALAIEHGLTLCSTDGDFARFKELRWINPLDITT